VSHVLPTREAYDRWAPDYPPEPHNPLMRVEQQTMLEYWPQVAGALTLDLASGTGRYAGLLQRAGAGEVVALDFSVAMLQQVAVARVRANMMALPFVAGAFDAVISGLALGHASELSRWMSEVARVLRDGGVLLYSDFHPEAARAGLTRSFRDTSNRSVTLPHCCHDVAAQREALTAAGLRLEVMREVRVGAELREEFPGSETFYRRWHGLPIVLIVRACK
jgi:ubiquinone/menaquinone biosynthesis C-methylase UbiE